MHRKLLALSAAFALACLPPAAAAERALVRFGLTGLNVHGAAAQPLQATANPAVTGLGRPPIIVTVAGGTPPYVVECSNPNGYQVTPLTPSTFEARRILNGVGRATITVTDARGSNCQVSVRCAMTGFNIHQQPTPTPTPTPQPVSTGAQARVTFRLSGLNVHGSPLAVSVNPPVTGFGMPPVVATVTGGRPPYTVSTTSATSFAITKVNETTFSLTRVTNGTGSSTLLVTDAAGATASCTVRSALTGINIH